MFPYVAHWWTIWLMIVPTLSWWWQQWWWQWQWRWWWWWLTCWQRDVDDEQRWENWYFPDYSPFDQDDSGDNDDDDDDHQHRANDDNNHDWYIDDRMIDMLSSKWWWWAKVGVIDISQLPPADTSWSVIIRANAQTNTHTLLHTGTNTNTECPKKVPGRITNNDVDLYHPTLIIFEIAPLICWSSLN